MVMPGGRAGRTFLLEGVAIGLRHVLRWRGARRGPRRCQLQALGMRRQAAIISRTICLRDYVLEAQMRQQVPAQAPIPMCCQCH